MEGVRIVLSSDLVVYMIKKEKYLKVIAQSLFWKDDLNGKTLKDGVVEYIMDTTQSCLARLLLRNELLNVDWDCVAKSLMEEASLGSEDSWTK